MEESKDEQTLDMVWQEMHLITSKLTQTQRKVTYLRKSNSSQKLTESSTKLSESMNSSFDDDNLSQLDSSRSEDISGGGGSSSGGSAVTPLSQTSDGSKVVISYGSKSKSEQRVYASLCRHLILQVFFEINKYQIESMVPPSDSSEASTDTTNIKKDIQECMREIQRVFKSIIKGSPEDGHKIFDDLHVIICLNKLLSSEQTLIQEDKNGNII